MNLRSLTDEGVRLFRAYLTELRRDPLLPPPSELLVGKDTSSELSAVPVQLFKFTNRAEVGSWLQDLFVRANLADPARDKGMWAWLSLFLFDSTCPPDVRGRRKPGEDARHIPDIQNFQRYYRHLLAGPWRIYRIHRDVPDCALAVLCQPIHLPGELVEQLASRQELITNRTIMTTATFLYVDPVTRQTRRGASGKSNGGVRRLADIFNQLDITWDLYAMDPVDLLDKIPMEFNRYKTQAFAGG